MLSFEGLQKRADDTWLPKDDDGEPTGVKVGESTTHTSAAHSRQLGSMPPACAGRRLTALMGHAAPVRQAGAAEITMSRYTHTLPGELEQARERLDALASEGGEEATG